jgi:hypothetical protein
LEFKLQWLIRDSGEHPSNVCNACEPEGLEGKSLGQRPRKTDHAAVAP